MDGNITLKSVLIECLGIIKEEQRLSSKDYNGLVPKEGMEESWDQARRKVQVLKDAIPALESEPVRAAMANWQKDVMENGPSMMQADDLVDAVRQLRAAGDKKKDAIYIPKHITEEERKYLINYIATYIPGALVIQDPADTAKQTLGDEPVRV